MKNYRNEKNELWAFDDDCFDEKENCINGYALKVIKENNLIEITKEEAVAIRNYKSSEQIAEEERLAKLPTQDELLKNQIQIEALNILTELGVI